jgi:hypothetical protein
VVSGQLETSPDGEPGWVSTAVAGGRRVHGEDVGPGVLKGRPLEESRRDDHGQAEPTVWLRFDGLDVRSIPLCQLRLEHFAGSVPWRRFRSRQGQAHLSGSYWAATTGGHVVYESRLELARLLLADFDPDVVGIYSQPCRLVTRRDGRQRHHVPDFLLVSSDGVVTVVNVKPAHRLADPVVAEALDWPGVLLAGHGWRYEVWSGCDPVVLDNVRFLAGYRRREVIPDEAVDRACRAVVDGEPLAVAERRLAAGGPSHGTRPALLAALWRGRLSADLTRPLSGTSILRRCGR